VRNATDDSTVPETLRPHKPLPKEDRPPREFRLSFDAVQRAWVINGKAYAPGQPGQIPVTPKLGTTELWRIINESPPPLRHSFHTHLARFEVVSRNGTPVDPNGPEGGLKDTVLVNGLETVEIRPYFGDYTGIYVFHCHNLLHEDSAMMAEMEVVP
jgi:FtsP/CotA-like multicopper oxidase with cupredoxin domain